MDREDLTITASDQTKTYGNPFIFDETTPRDFSVTGLNNARTR